MKLILLIVAISALITSYDLYNSFSCSTAEDCGHSFEFTLDYSTNLSTDTISIADTFIIHHEMPFQIIENRNLKEYNLQDIPYQPTLYMARLENSNQYFSVEPGTFELISVEGSGKIHENILSNGLLVFEIEFERLHDRYYLEAKVVSKKQGVYLLGFYYLEHLLTNQSFQSIDTCCQSQSIEFNYNCLNQTNQFETFTSDSIWYEEGVIEQNLKELNKRYDFHLVAIIE